MTIAVDLGRKATKQTNKILDRCILHKLSVRYLSANLKGTDDVGNMCINKYNVSGWLLGVMLI